MTSDEMQELKRLAQAATPGPYSLGGNKRSIEGQNGDGVAFANNIDNGVAHSNARYIAAANPAAVLALIARIEELEGK